LTLAEWLQTLADFRGLCAYCQERPFAHLEHFIPIDAGGGTTLDNCIPACGQCNWSKGADDPDRPQGALLVNDPRERVRNYLAARAQHLQDGLFDAEDLPWFD
jgi:5-methylcytosine-specific restriction endonuclease McrA